MEFQKIFFAHKVSITKQNDLFQIKKRKENEKMDEGKIFPSGIVLLSKEEDSCIESIFQTIKKELREEAQTVEVITMILNDAKEKITQIKIEL